MSGHWNVMLPGPEPSGSNYAVAMVLTAPADPIRRIAQALQRKRLAGSACSAPRSSWQQPKLSGKLPTGGPKEGQGSVLGMPEASSRSPKQIPKALQHALYEVRNMLFLEYNSTSRGTRRVSTASRGPCRGNEGNHR